MDKTEKELLTRLAQNHSKLSSLADEPIEFLERNKGATFSDPEYFRRQKELTDEAESILSELIKYWHDKNTDAAD